MIASSNRAAFYMFLDGKSKFHSKYLTTLLVCGQKKGEGKKREKAASPSYSAIMKESEKKGALFCRNGFGEGKKTSVIPFDCPWGRVFLSCVNSNQSIHHI
ncbi:hypothetical protein AVEN_157462-1 [Araneus ventricosus]|uniref:Uncharacterized protein n=1 Tax=Araneus ventricosus TaxID=182803 RepID=A0A4Y2QJX0_ARAVE|nr:hypothetical protein AVEN_157462-1 [Araneus ventricosus]